MKKPLSSVSKSSKVKETGLKKKKTVKKKASKKENPASRIAVRRKKEKETELRYSENLKFDIISFMDKHYDKFCILFVGPFWILAVKKVTLNVFHISNSEGFQPLERTEQSNKWVITLINIRGIGKSKDHIKVEELIEKGCPFITIRNVTEIERKLDEI